MGNGGRLSRGCWKETTVGFGLLLGNLGGRFKREGSAKA